MWNATVQPVLNMFMNAVTELWNAHLKPLWDNIKLFFKAVWDLIKQLMGVIYELWNSVIAPVLGYIAAGLGGILTTVISVVGTIVAKITGYIADIVGVIINFIAGVIAWISGMVEGIRTSLIGFWNWLWGWLSAIGTNIVGFLTRTLQFITGVIAAIGALLTGDMKGFAEGFKNIWEGMCGAMGNLFKGAGNIIIGIANGIIGVVEGMVNGIVKAFNRINFNFSIPDWVPLVGGKSWSFGLNLGYVSLPRFNYLANGGILDEPTAAMMAEYAGAHNNPEIVTPENFMREVFNEGNEELAILLDRNNRLLEAILDKNVSISIGDDVISAAAARGDRDFRKRTGRSQFAI